MSKKNKSPIKFNSYNNNNFRLAITKKPMGNLLSGNFVNHNYAGLPLKPTYEIATRFMFFSLNLI